MSKKILAIFTLICLVCVLIVGCGQNGSSSSSSSINPFPHADGMAWRYSYKTTSQIGRNDYFATEYFSGHSTLTNGLIVQNHYVSEETGGSQIFSSGFYLIDNSGAYYYWSTIEAEACLYLSFPLDIGVSWQRSYGYSYEVVAKEEITVPAGTFNATKVSLMNRPYNEHCEWYVDGIGLVKAFSRSLSRIDGTTETWVSTQELVSKNF